MSTTTRHQLSLVFQLSRYLHVQAALPSDRVLVYAANLRGTKRCDPRITLPLAVDCITGPLRGLRAHAAGKTGSTDRYITLLTWMSRAHGDQRLIMAPKGKTQLELDVGVLLHRRNLNAEKIAPTSGLTRMSSHAPWRHIRPNIQNFSHTPHLPIFLSLPSALIRGRTRSERRLRAASIWAADPLAVTYRWWIIIHRALSSHAINDWEIFQSGVLKPSPPMHVLKNSLTSQ